MKMIDVLNMMAENKIKHGMIIEFVGHQNQVMRYKYECHTEQFKDKYGHDLTKDFYINNPFLNKEVKLIEFEEQKYLILLKLAGLLPIKGYLNFDRSSEGVVIGQEWETVILQTHFTKSEIKSNKVVKDFLNDINNKYELIEVNL